MRFLTHSYVIIIYEDGKFCWKNKGWIKDRDAAANEGIFLGVVVYAIILAILN
tara:strand:+ start:492 stop:650 length:159 start_codon:yes stop_codon:yes gene_type:complete